MNITRCDDRDTRLTLFQLLAHPRMTPELRLHFLTLCCMKAQHQGLKIRPKPGTQGDAKEVYFDLCLLFVQHKLSVAWTVEKLDQWVRNL